MRIVFVYGNMYSVGGIQTLLARWIPKLRAQGHQVALLTRPASGPDDVTSEILDQIQQDATVHVADGHWLKAPRSLRGLRLGHADAIIPCNLQALLLSCVVQQHLTPSARIVLGVFAPREYCWKTSWLQRRWIQRRVELLLRELPLENFMFATDAMMRQTGECLGRDLRSSPVLPPAIDTERLRPPPNREINHRKIVSVQRLAPYYTYVAQMIRVIRDLRDQGHRFEYHVYGEGEMRAELEAESRRLGVNDAVVLHGAVPYDEFRSVVSDAFLYIGIGTGLIEAAACGIPALVAIDSHPGPVTYGFFQDTAGNDIGGYVPGHPEHPIPERVLWLAQRTSEEYQEMALAARVRAEEFSLDRLAPRFLEIVRGAAPWSAHISKTDRLLAALDGVRAAILRKLGVRDAMAERHPRKLLYRGRTQHQQHRAR